MPDMPAPEPPETFATRIDRHPRLQGLAGVGIGLGMAHAYIYEPLLAAQRIAAHHSGGTVTVHRTLAGASVGIALIGLVFLMGGHRATVWTGNANTMARNDPLREQLPARQVAFLVLGAVLCLSVSMWMEHEVARLVRIGKAPVVASPEEAP